MNKKIKKSFIYEGLGFPILLENVIFHQIHGEWLPRIDIEVLARTVFEKLPSKSSRLTGNEIKFIRTYLGKSKLAFADIFKLSHTAINKWESTGNSLASISPGQEMVLRLYLEDLLKVTGKRFYDAYKEIEASIYIEDEKPLKIAL